MTEDSKDLLQEGYLVFGTQKKVDGGLTLDFPKSNKYYFVLWSKGERSYLLQGFKNENAFKGKRKSGTLSLGLGRRPSISSGNCPRIDITSSIKVHCMDMLIGQKTCHVVILMNATFPYYFKTVSGSDIKPWKHALENVATAMEKPKPPEIMITLDNEESSLKHTHSKEHRGNTDSGIGSNHSTPRSSRSSFNSCPPSPSLIPNNICVELEENDNLLEAIGEDLTPSHKSRRQLAKSIIVRRRERTTSTGSATGKYEFKEEAHQSVYDSVIRTSFIADDDEHDGAIGGDLPQLPTKMRPRRKTEPALQLPPPDYFTRPNRRGVMSSTEAPSDIPPPLPERPSPDFQQRQSVHDYVNMARKQSLPGLMASHHFQLPMDPMYERCKNRKDMGFIMWEQEKQTSGIEETFSKAELLHTMVLVTVNKAVWVAAWKKDLNDQLYGRIRIGDRIRQINDQIVNAASEAEQFIKTTANDQITVTICRLPFAKVVEPQRAHSSILWGIEISDNKIKKVLDGPAKMYGITTDTRGALSPDTKRDWIVTEICHRPVPIFRSGKNQEFVKEEIEAPYTSLPLIIQPSDFIKKLSEGMPKRHASMYC